MNNEENFFKLTSSSMDAWSVANQARFQSGGQITLTGTSGNLLNVSTSTFSIGS